MRRRLILSTAAIALAAVIILGVPLGAVEAARLKQDTASRLEREADRVSASIDDRIERGQTITPAMLRGLIASRHSVSIVTSDGQRVSAGPPAGADPIVARSGADRRAPSPRLPRVAADRRAEHRRRARGRAAGRPPGRAACAPPRGDRPASG